MKKGILIFLLLILKNNSVLSQANAGPDKTVSASHPSVTIGTPAISSVKCYQWKSEPSDPLFTIANINEAQPTVNPTVTTRYTLYTVTNDGIFSKDEVTVYRLGIEYIRSSADKDWKIVVGEGIQFSAIADGDCTDWHWEMSDGDKWHLMDNNSRTGTTMKIPFSDLPGAHNDWFGEAFGTVTVSCKDAEGNLQTYSSTESSPSRKVKVYFNPLVNVDGQTPSNEKPACWFVFWKDGNVVEDIGEATYIYNLGDAGGWSHTTRIMALGPLSIGHNDGPYELLDLDGNVFQHTGEGKYIHYVAEILAHELYHRDTWDWYGGWGAIRPGHSDTDGLPDDEENSPSEIFFPRSDPRRSDSFSYNYPFDNGFDYSDNEVRARLMEKHKPKQVHTEKDWSKHIDNSNW